MMGRQPDPQPKLFYTRLNLEKRIRKDHILRKISKLVDFDFKGFWERRGYSDEAHIPTSS